MTLAFTRECPVIPSCWTGWPVNSSPLIEGHQARDAKSIDAGGFSLKRLHRLLVSSSAYRQSSKFNADAAKVDAADRFVWRVNPRRLEAEEVRDSMLAVAGELNTQIGGRGIIPTSIRISSRGRSFTIRSIRRGSPTIGAHCIGCGLAEAEARSSTRLIARIRRPPRHADRQP